MSLSSSSAFIEVFYLKQLNHFESLLFLNYKKKNCWRGLSPWSTSALVFINRTIIVNNQSIFAGVCFVCRYCAKLLIDILSLTLTATLWIGTIIIPILQMIRVWLRESK